MGSTMDAERMPMRRRRVVRGTAGAAIAVLFAATAHTLSGGDAPPLWLILAVTVLAAPLCVALVGRRRSIVRLGSAVVAAQVALHAAFAAVGSAAPAGAAHVGHHHDLAMLSTVAVDPAAATMTLGHVAAALVTIVVLAWGERMLGAIARGIRRLLRLSPVSVPAHIPAPASFVTPRRAIAGTFPHSVSRRGPPTRPASILAV